MAEEVVVTAWPLLAGTSIITTESREPGCRGPDKDARIGPLTPVAFIAEPAATRNAVRSQNSTLYRLAHWPIWIAVFFIQPGPWIVRLLADGLGLEQIIWLVLVTIFTGLAGLFGKLPGAERFPYVGGAGEDKPNPLYRRICYIAAWSGLLSYTILNLAGLIDVLGRGTWHLQAFYRVAFYPVAVGIWIAGALGLLPMAKGSVRGQAPERQSFYEVLTATVIAEPILGILSQVLAQTRSTYAIELTAFVAASALGFVWGRRIGRR